METIRACYYRVGKESGTIVDGNMSNLVTVAGGRVRSLLDAHDLASTAEWMWCPS